MTDDRTPGGDEPVEEGSVEEILDNVVDFPAQPLASLGKPAPPAKWFRTNGRGESVIEYRLGGKVYSMRKVNGCKTCESDYRVEIEIGLLKGYAYTKIARSLPEDSNLTARNIGDHSRNGHLPIDASIQKIIIDERAGELGLDIDEYEGTLADYRTFIRLGVQRSLELMQEGKLYIDTDHAIQFAMAEVKLQQQAGEAVNQQAVIQSLIILRNAVEKVCTPKQIEDIKREITMAQLASGERLAVEVR